MKEFKERRRNDRNSVLKLKKLHGQYFNQIEDKKRNKISNYAAQEQAIRKNAMKAKIDKTQAESKCRLRGKVYETVRHIVRECPTLVQSEYKRRHDSMGRKVHWEVCRKTGFDVNEKWYKHEPEKVVKKVLGRHHGCFNTKLSCP